MIHHAIAEVYGNTALYGKALYVHREKHPSETMQQRIPVPERVNLKD
jgi:hypothetical protein